MDDSLDRRKTWTPPPRPEWLATFNRIGQMMDIKSVISLMKLDSVFQTMVYGDDMPHGKPAPDIYFETARRLGIEPSAFIGIEDSSNGIRALHNADMRIIAVPSPGFTLPPDVAALADITLTTLEDFSLDAIAQLDA